MTPSPQMDYCRWIELHWSLARGNQIIVSPLEFEVIQSWFTDQVPIEVVTRGIDRFMERKKRAKRQRQMLLNHVDGDVRKLHAEYKLLHIGAYDEAQGDDVDKVASKLKSLAKKIRKIGAFDWLADELLALSRPESIRTMVGFEDVEDHLAELESRLDTTLSAMAGEEVHQSIRQELDEFLDKKDDAEFYQKAYNDQLRQHFEVPHLTILG